MNEVAYGNRSYTPPVGSSIDMMDGFSVFYMDALG